MNLTRYEADDCHDKVCYSDDVAKLEAEVDKHREFLKAFDIWINMIDGEWDLTKDIIKAYDEMIKIREKIT